MTPTTQTPPPAPQVSPAGGRFRGGCSFFLLISGIACLALALLMIVYGIAYGYTEDRAFYARQDAYHAQDAERAAIDAELDSLRHLLAEADPIDYDDLVAPDDEEAIEEEAEPSEPSEPSEASESSEPSEPSESSEPSEPSEPSEVSEAAAAGDTLLAARLRAQIDSIETSDRYEDLYGIPAPPQGFSMAYVVTIILCALALLPLGLGIALLIAWRVRRRRSE